MGRTCVFCQIVGGEKSANIVFEDAVSVCFLDRRPLFPGHCLLVPREHYETLMDLPSPLIGPLFGNAQLIARAMEQGLPADGSLVAINNRVSQSVPHAHIHIIPRQRGDGLKGFFWPRHPYRDEAHLLETQDKLRQAIAQPREGR